MQKNPTFEYVIPLTNGSVIKICALRDHRLIMIDDKPVATVPRDISVEDMGKIIKWCAVREHTSLLGA